MFFKLQKEIDDNLSMITTEIVAINFVQIKLLSLQWWQEKDEKTFWDLRKIILSFTQVRPTVILSATHWFEPLYNFLRAHAVSIMKIYRNAL